MTEAKKILPTIKITKRKGRKQCPIVSDIDIFFDDEKVASGTLGGDHNDTTVLKALKTPDKKKFKVTNEFLFNTLT